MLTLSSQLLQSPDICFFCAFRYGLQPQNPPPFRPQRRLYRAATPSKRPAGAAAARIQEEDDEVADVQTQQPLGWKCSCTHVNKPGRSQCTLCLSSRPANAQMVYQNTNPSSRPPPPPPPPPRSDPPPSSRTRNTTFTQTGPVSATSSQTQSPLRHSFLQGAQPPQNEEKRPQISADRTRGVDSSPQWRTSRDNIGGRIDGAPPERPLIRFSTARSPAESGTTGLDGHREDSRFERPVIRNLNARRSSAEPGMTGIDGRREDFRVARPLIRYSNSGPPPTPAESRATQDRLNGGPQSFRAAPQRSQAGTNWSPRISENAATGAAWRSTPSRGPIDGLSAGIDPAPQQRTRPDTTRHDFGFWRISPPATRFYTLWTKISGTAIARILAGCSEKQKKAF